MAPNYNGPERRIEPRDEAFERAVRQATRIASQEVAKIHRVRLVTQAFLASLTVALSVAVVIGLVFRAEAIDRAKREGEYNCQLVKALSATLGDFIATDATANAETVRHWTHVDLLRLRALAVTDCSRAAS